MINRKTRSVLGKGMLGFDKTPLLMIVAIVVGNAAPETAGAAENDEAIALLRGVENVRQEVRSGKLKITVLSEHPSMPNYGSDEMNLEVVFDGIKRRYTVTNRFLMTTEKHPNDAKELSDKFVTMGRDRDALVKQGLGEWRQEKVRLIYNGEFVAWNHLSGFEVRIQEPKKNTEWWCFDPRILGIAVIPFPVHTIESCLPYRVASLASVVEDKDKDANQTQLRHVRLVMKNAVVRDYWIGRGFTVVKHEWHLESLKRRRVVTAEYNEKIGPVIPWRSTCEIFSNGEIQDRTTFTCRDVQLDIPTDPSMFEMTGLNLQRGRTVYDGRLHKTLYWDGKQLVDELPGIVELQSGGSMSKGRLISISILSFLVFVTVIIWRRMSRRGAKSPD